MYILSIDVGIKNLAFILIKRENKKNDNFSIISWDVVDLCNTEKHICQFKEKDKGKNKGKDKICNKTASLFKNDYYTCKIHAKKHATFILPSEQVKANTLQKTNTEKLKSMAESYNLSLEKTTKSYIIKQIKQFYKNNTFLPIPKTNATQFNLIDLGISLKDKFNQLFEKYTISTVLIENQISPIANRMKSIQAMITQYFIMKECYDIQYISSINKLKIFEEQPTNYRERKQLGIDKTLIHLKDSSLPDTWIQHFSKHKKKDDLADAFLQFLYYLKT